MYIANVENSEIDVSGIRTVLVQGDSAYPSIRFVLDPSLTGLSWRVRGTYLASNIAVTSPELVATETASSVALDWSVASDFTTYSGEMQLSLVGSNELGTVITKALGDIVIKRDHSIGTMAEITLNLFEQLFAQTESAISTHNTSATAHANQIAPLVTNHNWLYDGRDLSAIFTAAQFIAAVRADDWSNIRIGDYWPITLNGTFRDYGSYTCPTGTNYYSDTGLTTLVGQTATSYQAAYVNETYCSITISSTTYYVSTTACTTYYIRTLSNALMKLEVAAISPYIDTGNTSFTSPHVVFVSRDAIPMTTKMRKANSVWTDTAATNPWLGSALYKTLNEPTYGLLPMVAATDIGAYIYTGFSSRGMTLYAETKASGVSSATNNEFISRGCLFVPTEPEMLGSVVASEPRGGRMFNQFPLFINSSKHRIKRLGSEGTKAYLWTCSSVSSSSTAFVCMSGSGVVIPINSADTSVSAAAPLCFIVA